MILSIFRRIRTFDKLTVIGGGVQSPQWRQIMADIFDLDVEVPNYLEEATSMGAAITAGVGVGAFPDFSAIHKFIRMDSLTHPIPENRAVYDALAPLFDKAYFALAPLYKELAGV